MSPTAPDATAASSDGESAAVQRHRGHGQGRRIAHAGLRAEWRWRDLGPRRPETAERFASKHHASCRPSYRRRLHSSKKPPRRNRRIDLVVLRPNS